MIFEGDSVRPFRYRGLIFRLVGNNARQVKSNRVTFLFSAIRNLRIMLTFC